MKIKVFTIVALLVFSIMAVSCIVTSRLINVDISCKQFQENPNSIINEFQIETGDKITVKLCSNPSTGFEWEYTMTGDDVLKEEDYDFEEPEEDIPGAAGKEVWTFEGTATGTVKVLMEYSQPWEDGIKQEWTYSMTITVQ